MSQNAQLVNWLNEAGLASGIKKTEILRKVQELLVHQVPQLIPTYLDTILSYAADRNQDVKKQIITFIEDICKAQGRHIPAVLPQLRLLLQDTAVAVQKRVIQAAGLVYRQALIWICKGGGEARDKHFVWEQLTELKLNILNMIDSENEGIRTNSIKFLESMIVLQTYSEDNSVEESDDFSLDDVPETLSFIKRQTLEEESEHVFSLLLKFHNSQHISSVNLMACMTALCSVAKLRPQYMARVTRALADLHTTLPPTLSQSQLNSVRKHLKMLLLNTVKHPSSNEMLPHLTRLLSDIGMTSQEIAKAIPRERRNKRVYELKNGDSAGVKRPRIDSPQSNSQSSERSDISATFQESNEPTERSMNEDQIFDALKNIDTVIDLVTATLTNLPPRIPLDFLQLYSPISNAGTLIQRRLLAKQLAEIINDESPSISVPDNLTQIPLLKDEDEKSSSLKSAVAKLAETEKLERKIENAVSKLMEENKMDKLREKKEKLIPPPTPTVPKLKQRVKLLQLQEITKPLPKHMKEKLMLHAVERILKAERDSEIGGVPELRIKLLTTFASTYTTETRQLVLAYILEDIPERFDLAMSWMYEEYSYMQGYIRQPLTLNPLKSNEKHDQHYNNLLCALITNVAEATDPALEAGRNRLLRKIYLEAPLLTDDALEFLKHLVCEGHKSSVALDLLEEIIKRRPPKAGKYIGALLCHTINEVEFIREKATRIVVELYEQAAPESSMRRAIEKQATLQLGFLSLPTPPHDLFTLEAGRPDLEPVWTEPLYRVCFNLYLCLLPANESLLLELARVYAGSSAEAKRCVLRSLEGPVRRMASHASPQCPPPACLALLGACPRGAETLATRLVHALTERAPPSPILVDHVRDLYSSRVADVRFLIPVLNGLTKKEILAALPKLIKLNPVVVKEVFNKLLGLNNLHGENLPVSPAELLVALHLVDPAKAELKHVIKATALCFAEKQAYTQEVLALAIQQLVEQPEIPVLLMRTLLQALTLYPQLSGFAVNMLQRLVAKEVWNNKVAWEGFIKCCSRTLPASLSPLLLLPGPALSSALASCPALSAGLAQHAATLTPEQRLLLPATALPITDADDQTFVEHTYNPGVVEMEPPRLEPLPPGME